VAAAAEVVEEEVEGEGEEDKIGKGKHLVF
jgi:hypothetical protein